MKKIFYSALALSLGFASCQKDGQNDLSKQTAERINLKSIAQAKNFLSSNGIGAK